MSSPSPVHSLVDPASFGSDGPPSVIRFQPAGSFVVVENSSRYGESTWEQLPLVAARRLWAAKKSAGWAVPPARRK